MKYEQEKDFDFHQTQLNNWNGQTLLSRNYFICVAEFS
jgi:hypothetical protein